MLLVGTWFAVLSSVAESVLLGVGKPAALAAGNLIKLLLIVVAAPPALMKYGLAGAIVVFVAAEVARYVTLVIRQRSSDLAFLRQDMAATGAFLAFILLMRELTGLAGLTSGLPGWIHAMHRL
jgi:O-antigen/teichoic acid export membrane protein